MNTTNQYESSKMFVGSQIVKLNKFEGRALIESIVQSIQYIIVSESFLQSMSLIFISFAVHKQPLRRDQWDRLLGVFESVQIPPPSFIHKDGSYYHKLYDSHFPDQDRSKAKVSWNRMIDRAVVPAVDIHWNNQTMLVLERIRDCGIHPSKIALITKYLFDIDCMFIDENAAQKLGELKVVA